MATKPGLNPLFQLTPSQVNRAESEQWRQIVRQALNDTRCASPAFLTEDLDPGTNTVTVQIAIQEQVRTNTGPQWWDVPPIIMVPVIMPRGGGWAVTLPLKKGDEGILIFCDTCFDLWWQNGQDSSTPAHTNKDTTAVSGSQKQNEIRRHHVHDCGFWPGMWSQPNVLEDYSTDSLQIRSDDGSTSIDVAGSGITLTTPLVIATENLQIDNGATGSFTTPTGQVVTVDSGIITNIF